MTKTFDINKYIQLKRDVKQYYKDIKLGEQSLYENQSNLFKPLTDVTREQSQAIQDKLTSNQDILKNTLVPLQQRIDELELHSIEEVDKDFAEGEISFLASKKLDLPSVVLKKQTSEETLERIVSINHSIGQAKRYGKITEEEYNKRTSIMKKYKDRIIEGVSTKAVTGSGLLKQKRSRGRPKTKVDAIIYKDYNDLIEKLHNFTSSYKAGNTGVHNYIVEILDELREQKVIGKSEYDNIQSNILSL